jgi:hypothetical protein
MHGGQRVVIAAVAAAVIVGLPDVPARTQARTVPPGAPSAELARHRDAVRAAFARLPPAFVENRGQLSDRVRYSLSGSGYAFSVATDRIVLAMTDPATASPVPSGRVPEADPSGPATRTRGLALALTFLGANPDVVVEGTDRVPGAVNYFLGSDPARWTTGLPRFAEVRYRDLWPGIDLALQSRAAELKYEFRVRPGARVGDIRLAYEGATRVTRDAAGALVIETAIGVLRDAPPVTYQVIDGVRVGVESRYIVEGERGAGGYRFEIGGSYDPTAELVIDPGIQYSTFVGGSSHDYVAGIAIDGAGSAYVVGTTQSGNFPATTGAFDRTLASTLDVFVARLDASGSRLIYATYLGGTPAAVPAGGSDPFEFGRAIAVDAAGNAYVTGQTTSSNFPTTSGAFDRSLNIGTFDATDAFVTKLNATGSSLVYSTFLGGTDLDDGLGIAVDGGGTAFIAGQTASRNFPVTAGSLDTTANGGFDGFVARLNAAGSALLYSTYLGGADNESADRVAIDAGDTGTVVAGSTRSADFPTTGGAFDTTHNGGFDAYVARLNLTGSGLIYSTFLGGGDVDFGDSVALDGSGNAYVAGGTLSLDFPTTAGAFDRTRDGGSDVFLTKIDAAGSSLLYSTLLGGTNGEGAAGVAVDGSGAAWVTGGTSSADFPTTADAFDRTLNGPSDAYATQLNAAGSAIVYSTLLGGTGSDNARDLALDGAGGVYVAGETQSSDFPTTSGAFDRVFNGDPSIFWGDGFVTKLGGDGGTPPPPPAAALSAVTLTPDTVVGGNPSSGTVTLTAAAPDGGAVVALADNSAAAAVPSSVTVPSGAVSAGFAVATSAVSTSTSATVSATYLGVTRSATLAITPGDPPPPPPAETATLTVTVTGRSGQRVTSSPSGIDVPVGSTGSASFAVGTRITLTASNRREAVWSGACSSDGRRRRSCTFTLTGPATVTANVR